jgi:TolA-binding protein
MSVEDDFQEIKQEIVQSHNLIIKTDNLIKNLSAEIRQIQKKQEIYERKYWISSIGAYAIVAAVCFVGVYIGFEAKVNAERREKETLTAKLEQTQDKADDLQQKLSVRTQQEKVAEKILRLKREKRDVEALKVGEGLDINRLSPVLGRLVTRETDELRIKIGKEALDSGNSLLQKGYLKRAKREYDKAIAVKPPGKILAEAHYHRANVQTKLNRNSSAAEDYLLAAKADPLASFCDLALYMAAGSLETSGDTVRAVETYKKLIAQHGKSRWASTAKRRLARLLPKKETSPPKKSLSATRPTTIAPDKENATKKMPVRSKPVTKKGKAPSADPNKTTKNKPADSQP